MHEEMRALLKESNTLSVERFEELIRLEDVNDGELKVELLYDDCQNEDELTNLCLIEAICQVYG